MRAGRVTAVALVSVLAGSCGYHMAGRGELLPATIKTISIPAFDNLSARYKLTDRLPEAIAREFITRTRYRVVPREEAADAVLRGAVVSYTSFPTILDPATSRAATVELRVMLQLNLVERSTGNVLFTRPAFEVRERYQISIDPARYYEESEDALLRASQQVARNVVTAILDSF